ncbi:hypothetical protein [Modestobacter sp. I12A-02662]|uniref:hypothetical protein n=1 Tax=Modestobacter sp. I12A-02662 TaxID=1730496 RepID=UPI0034DEB39E
MAIESRSTGTGRQIVAYTPTGGTEVIDPESNTLKRTLRALNDYGREGWQLVGTELIAEQGVYRATHFPKRPLEQAGGGWAVGV